MKAYVNALDEPLTEYLRAYVDVGRLEASIGIQGARAAPEETAGALKKVLRCVEE